jgi:nucleotide-binding universal stress UspA family protein
MSQVQPLPTSQPSLPPSSPISPEAAATKQPEIRFAVTDDDVIAIHRFLLVVAAPAMLAPVSAVKSLHEVFRVAAQEAAIMAIVDGFLVGTLGLMKVDWWYSDEGSFLTDRWHFVLPQHKHGPIDKALLNEARAIADDAGLPFVNQGKIRRLKDGSHLMTPRVYFPE